MRKIIITLFLGLLIFPASARMCKLDWVSVWRNASGILQDSGRAFATGRGTSWSVYARQGATGLQTLTGLSHCNNSSTSPLNTADGINCWCRMINPNAGEWIFLNVFGTAEACMGLCAHDCTRCVRDGASHSCTRAALLIFAQ